MLAHRRRPEPAHPHQDLSCGENYRDQPRGGVTKEGRRGHQKGRRGAPRCEPSREPSRRVEVREIDQGKGIQVRDFESSWKMVRLSPSR
jgi:hypothetical protein